MLLDITIQKLTGGSQGTDLVGHTTSFFLSVHDCNISSRITFIPRGFGVLAVQSDDFKIILLSYA